MRAVGVEKEVYGASLMIEEQNQEKKAQIQLYKDGILFSVYQYCFENPLGTTFAYGNNIAREAHKLLTDSLKKAKGNKNKFSAICYYGTAVAYSVETKTGQFEIALFNKLPVMVETLLKNGSELRLNDVNHNNIDYAFTPYWVEEERLIPLTSEKKALENRESEDNLFGEDEYEPAMRTLEEISLLKDLNFLKDKKYYIVQDDEYVLNFLDRLRNYSGMVVLDYETSGLYINIFGKKHSKYSNIIQKWNNDPEKEFKYKTDYVVGVIFCTQPNVSFYFPLRNRKFANVFQTRGTEARRKAIDWILAQYTLVYQGRQDTDMYQYWQRVRSGEVSYDEVESDDIFMELSRPILERGIVPWGGKFEYKCGLLYDIDTVLTDDGMTLHQMLFKFRSTRRNSGESSALKFQTEKEFGITPLELDDVFVEYREDDDSTVKLNPKARGIDFSYMTYETAWAYAPADGDFTFQLVKKYRKYMEEQKPEIQYLYAVELLVTCALGYAEFCGITIMEDEIERTRKIFEIKNAIIEGYIRQSYLSNMTQEEINAIQDLKKNLDIALSNNGNLDEVHQESLNLLALYALDENRVNLGSPKQVAQLLFPNGEQTSVASKVLKQLKKKVDKHGKLVYPLIGPYQEWKSNSTLLTKFFDKLPDFMYPGGHIFASFGQISTATGRMSCKTPNLQQLPSEITSIMHARPGCVYIDADYSQIELRVMGALANVYTMLPLYEDEDADIHTLIAHRMYEVPYESVTEDLRSDAKKFNFGIPYQMGLSSLAILLFGVPTDENKKKADEKRKAYFNAQPNLEEYFNTIKQHVKAHGYTKTAWGRERLYDFTDKDGKFSQAKQAMSMRQSVNAVIQGTAADIFKIGLSRAFYWVRKNRLFYKVYLTNFIHDEILTEIRTDAVNFNQALVEITNAMQFHVEGFPSLFVGGGVDFTWSKAKGKKNEIHQAALRNIKNYVRSTKLGLYDIEEGFRTPEEVVESYKKMNYKFRLHKIKSYLENPESKGKKMHPVVTAYLRMEFFTDDVKKRKEELLNANRERTTILETLQAEKEALEKCNTDREKYADEIQVIEGHIKKAEAVLTDIENHLEFQALLQEFIRKYCDKSLKLNEDDFLESINIKDVEEAVLYNDDGEDENEDALDDDFYVTGENFEIISDDQLFGTSIEEWIRTFILVASPTLGILGVDGNQLSKNQQKQLIDFVEENRCEPNEPGSLELVMLLTHNIMKRSGIYVSSSSVDIFINQMQEPHTK